MKLNSKEELDSMRLKCFKELQINRKPYKQFLKDGSTNLGKDDKIYIELFD